MSGYILDCDPENLWAEQCTIAAAASVANGVYTQGRALVGILMPAAWTAASLGYDVSLDGVNWATAYDTNGNFEQTIVAASVFVCIPLSDAIFAPYLRLKSVVAASPTVNTAQAQVAAATIILLFRRYLGGS